MSKINYQDWFEEIKEHIIRDTEKRVVCEVIEFLVEESEDHSWDDFGIIELNILPRLRKKYGVRDD